MTKATIIRLFAWTLGEARGNLGMYTGGSGEATYRHTLERAEKALATLRESTVVTPEAARQQAETALTPLTPTTP